MKVMPAAVGAVLALAGLVVLLAEVASIVNAT